MSRHLLPLTKANRTKALQGIEAAIRKAAEGERPWTLELRPGKRTDEQNRALWSILGQIQKQRPTHKGVAMTAETWKSVFLQALGAEMIFVPTLDGTAVFPLGHRSSQLTKAEFTALLELMLAWSAQEGLKIEHFDGSEGSGLGITRPEVAA
jgi:hypothetical protein